MVSPTRPFADLLTKTVNGTRLAVRAEYLRFADKGNGTATISGTTSARGIYSFDAATAATRARRGDHPPQKGKNPFWAQRRCCVGGIACGLKRLVTRGDQIARLLSSNLFRT
jgi:hypothetical protein